MMDLQRQIGEWGDQTFPYDKRNWHEEDEACVRLLMHLEEEYDELTEAFSNVGFPLLDTEVEDVAYEAADMVILLFRLAHICGFDLLQAVERKMEVNRTRVWGAPDERGLIRHVEGLPPGNET